MSRRLKSPRGRDRDRILDAQEIAILHHCRLAGETLHPRFGRVIPFSHSIIVTVNSGYE